MPDNNIFDEYHDAIFARANAPDTKDYDKHTVIYDRCYGGALPENRNCEILDIGCGTGLFLYYLKKNSYTNYYGIDISKGQVEFCKKNVTEKVQAADAFEFLKGKSKRYELITANDMLEHIPKPRVLEFLALVKEALRDDGTFLLKVPNMGNPFSLYLRYKDFTHECGYTEMSLHQVLYSAGFRNIVLSGAGSGMPGFVEGALHYFIKKLYWWQGFVAPKVLSSLLVGKIQK